MEFIINIVESTFKLKEASCMSYDGFIISTNKQQILFGIYNEQCCCENWGYFMTNDSIKDFKGAELLSVELTGTDLTTKELSEHGTSDYANLMFVTLKTNVGVLQFVAYNEHNGYYGHDAVIVSEQLTYSEIL